LGNSGGQRAEYKATVSPYVQVFPFSGGSLTFRTQAETRIDLGSTCLNFRFPNESLGGFGMKMNRGYALVLSLLVALLLVSAAFAQETTGGLQGVVKDPQGLVVSKATVEVSGTKLIGVKKVETDASGYYRFANLPPGDYVLTVTAQGFRTLKQGGITLETGHLPTLDLKLEVGGIEQTVEVTGAAPLIDVATSKVQTIVTSDVLAAAPKGRSFQSVIAFAPGARSEPMQGGANDGTVGYQIDGATNSENSYLVEGQETANIRTGASNTNVPMEFIQEVQVKSSGFEAEYGGALGGVVNVIQKRGGNAWHGSVFTYYQGDIFDAAPDRYQRKNPDLGQPGAGTVGRQGQPYQYYQPKKDHYRYIDPGFEAGGYLLKDKLWAFMSSAPRFQNTTRTIHSTFANADKTFTQNAQTLYSLARVDYLATSKIRVYGAWQYNYQKVNGNLLPNADDQFGARNTSAGNDPSNYFYGLGYRAPNMIFNTGGDITITPNLISTTRYGYFYNNYGSRGVPIGDRYYYRSPTYSYNVNAAAAPAGTGDAICRSYRFGTNPDGSYVCPTGAGHTLGEVFPSAVHSSAFTTMADNTQTAYDQYSRKSFSTDLAWFKKAFGTHNIKGGFAMNKLNNNVLTGFANSQTYVGFGTTYSPTLASASTSGGRTGPGEHCTDVIAENQTLYGLTAVEAGKVGCSGFWGAVNLRESGTTGQVGSNNKALYVQDAWTVGHGVTLNLGIRFDEEDLPSYNPLFSGIAFGWGDKVAPRLGGSWDVFQNGKLKVYGSWGQFYDIMKYELPRGSFGGDYWHDCAYTLDNPNFQAGFIPVRAGDGHYCPLTGPANGTTTGGRFINNEDFRQPSNDPNSNIDPITGLPRSGVDPNLKPMKSWESVVGADWAITNMLALESRWSRKRLVKTIEDTGVLTPYGESYYISNPGFGDDAVSCTGCPNNPRAQRRYDSLEFRLVKKASDKWFGTMSYTWSALKGNYSGLTATDIADGGGGRNSPNVDRAFDEPFMSFDSHGRVIDGPLATDRPNTFKAYGYYRLKFGRFESLFGGTQFWYQGTPLTTYANTFGAPVYLEGRGNVANVTNTGGNWVLNGISSPRTPSYSQTDFNFVQNYHVSKTNENLMLGFEANITNLFNQHSPIWYDYNLGDSTVNLRNGSISTDGVGTSANYPVLLGATGGYDYIAIANSTTPKQAYAPLNSAYGTPYGWQSQRTMRFKVKFVF
jgi:hypothetical protein